jgi:pyruvate dehydrogenase E2 component (dihydrolipoamide acetyltransferase)
MINEVFMPALSSTMTEGKIVSWLKSPGDKVEKGETVVVVESDKADMDVEAFYSGYLAAIVVPAGETADVGMAIALIAETEAEIATAKQQATSASQSSSAGNSAPAAAVVAEKTVEAAPAAVATNGSSNGVSGTSTRLIASPRAKKMAKESGVNLSTLKGSGPHGRITAADVEAATGKAQPSTVPTAASSLSVAPAPIQPVVATPVRTNVERVVPFNTLQNAVNRNMMASLHVPTFHVDYAIATGNLDKLYKQVKSKGVTMTALLAKAVAMTLEKHPLLNASYSDAGIQYPSGINVAVAVAMDDGGLITPVLPNANRLDIYSLSRTWKDLVDRARSKQLQPDEYSTGTFTISNLGMFGVDFFDAILPPGQGSILAIGASRPQVVANAEGLIGVRQQMQVNITCDHRVIYGSHAAAFLQDLAKLIETNPTALTM